MKRLFIALTCVTTMGLASCASTGDGMSTSTVSAIDAKLASINSKVGKYCLSLETTLNLASVVSNKPLLTKVIAAVDTYCDNSEQVKDVPSAVAALVKAYEAILNAGIKPPIQVASN